MPYFMRNVGVCAACARISRREISGKLSWKNERSWSFNEWTQQIIIGVTNKKKKNREARQFIS